MEKQTVAVLGPGSWGTALSQVLNDNGHEVRLWGNIQEQIDEINTDHTNKRYFKDIVISEEITATTDLKAALDGVDAILFVVPTKVTRQGSFLGYMPHDKDSNVIGLSQLHELSRHLAYLRDRPLHP